MHLSDSDWGLTEGAWNSSVVIFPILESVFEDVLSGRQTLHIGSLVFEVRSVVIDQMK